MRSGPRLPDGQANPRKEAHGVVGDKTILIVLSPARITNACATSHRSIHIGLAHVLVGGDAVMPLAYEARGVAPQRSISALRRTSRCTRPDMIKVNLISQ